MTERRESSRNLQFEAKDDTKLKQKDKEKEKSRAKTSDDLDKIKSDDKNTTEKRAALKRSHSKSGSLTTKSITRKESSHLTLSPTDKRSGSPTVSLELTKSDDSALKSQREQSTPPTSAKLSKSEEKPNPMESSLGATKETPKDGPSISEESEPTPEQLNDIEYWKKRCGDLDQEVEKLKYANKSLEEQVRQQRLLIEKFLPNSPGAASHPKPIQRTNSSGDAKEEVEKRTKEKKEEEIVPKLQLETFKRVHKPAILSKKDPDDRTRVVGEMLTTEQSYLHGIEIMLNNYLYPLRKAAQKDKENAKKDVHKKVESSDVDSIFLNIEQLHLINSNLYEQLLKRLEDWEANDTIGDLLAEWAPKLKPYCRYGGNYEAAIQRVQELKERNVQFAKILDACDQQSNAFNGLSLRDYMIMPVQRVPRYSMLFHDLLKKTDKSHRDYEKLTVACLEIEKTANAVNEQIRQFQNETKLAEIYNRGGNFMILKDSYRRFVRDWNMEVVMDMNDKKFGKKEGELILFNDLFVASNFIMRKATLVEAAQVIPLMWIEVDIAKRQKWMEQLNAESLSAENAVVLYGPERAWFVKAKNLKERNEFVDSIAKVVGIADMSDKAAMREGTRKGSFTFTMPKGHYDGEWMAGQMHGRGRYVRDDGAVFDGYWDARIMAGFGIVTLPDQEPFPSGWLNNRTTEGGNVEVASKEHDFWGAGGLTDSDWQVLLLGAQEVTMKKDEKIIEQGITNENLYKVKSGTIRVEKQLPDGSKKLLVKLGANETFGDTSVLQSLATATASVIADSDQVVLRVIQIDLVFEIFKNNPGLCMRFYRQMATKLAERLRNLHNKAPLPKKDELKAESTDGPGSSGPASTASSGEHPSLTERLSTRNLKRISMHSADLDSNSGTSTPRENTPSTERKKDSKDKKDKEKEKDKKKQVAEVSFHEKFDLPLTEVVIKEVRCEIKMSTSKKPGQMYISQRYVCFDSSLFGSHTKEVVQLSKVVDITMKKKDLKLKMKKNQFTFIFNTSLEEAHSLIVSLWEKAKQEADGDGQTSGPASTEVSSRKLESRPSRRISLNPQTAKASLEPKATEEDWRLVLQGAKDLHFQKDQVILKEGVEHQCVYQIVHGNCRIEKETPEGTKKVLGSMEQGQLFGEMSFLQGGGATVSVVADEEVTVYVIEGDYINALFGRYPDLAGRFYHFLSSVLANRLNKRESDLAKAEEKAKSRRAKSKRVSTQSTDLSADDAEHRKSRKLLGDSADDLAKSSEDGASGTEKKRRKKKDRESGDDWSKLESQINAKHDEVEGEFARANSNLVNIPEDKEGEKKKKAEGESGPTSDNPKKIRKTKSTRDTKKDALNPTIVVEEETK